MFWVVTHPSKHKEELVGKPSHDDPVSVPQTRLATLATRFARPYEGFFPVEV
jgi:hypothetical protein